MACYHPIPALQQGSEAPRLWPPIGTENLALPCGTCIGCLSARATQWAHRCEHEATRWTSNLFIHLTYDDANLPYGGYLVPRDLQLFIKRLRKSAQRPDNNMRADGDKRLRYFACGEYGERNHRPHYHAIIFNCGFTDRYKVGSDLYQSATLSALWPAGLVKFGDATPAAANYIAQYTLKKQRYNAALGRGPYSRRYTDTDGYIDDDGVWNPHLRPAHNRAPEAPFLRMSLKPGIGIPWLTKYRNDLVHGYLVQKGGQKHAIPRAYTNWLADNDSHLAEDIDYNTYKHRRDNPTDAGTPERLRDGEIIHHRYKELTEHRNL